MAGQLREREKEDDGKVRGFTDWVLLMQGANDDNLEQQTGQYGYESNKWKEALGDELGGCGVYEFQVRRNHSSKTVYVGCTCKKRNDSSLQSRISEYVKNGSHKKGFIDLALQNGYKIYVRVQKLNVNGSTKHETMQRRAETMENTLLAMYDYAWNKRSNGGVRNVLTKPHVGQPQGKMKGNNDSNNEVKANDRLVTSQKLQAQITVKVTGSLPTKETDSKRKQPNVQNATNISPVKTVSTMTLGDESVSPKKRPPKFSNMKADGEKEECREWTSSSVSTASSSSSASTTTSLSSITKPLLPATVSPTKADGEKKKCRESTSSSVPTASSSSSASTMRSLPSITKPLQPATVSPTKGSVAVTLAAAERKDQPGSVAPDTSTTQLRGQYRKVTIQSDTSLINGRKATENESTDNANASITSSQQVLSAVGAGIPIRAQSPASSQPQACYSIGMDAQKCSPLTCPDLSASNNISAQMYTLPQPTVRYQPILHTHMPSVSNAILSAPSNTTFMTSFSPGMPDDRALNMHMTNQYCDQQHLYLR